MVTLSRKYDFVTNITSFDWIGLIRFYLQRGGLGANSSQTRYFSHVTIGLVVIYVKSSQYVNLDDIDELIFGINMALC